MLRTTLTLTALALLAAGCAARATDSPGVAAGRQAEAQSVNATQPPARQGEGEAPSPQGAAQGTNSGAGGEARQAGARGRDVAAASAEWPQWRGPKRDGVAAAAAAPKSWPKELKEQWRVTVGVGHSSPIAAGGRVYHFTRIGEAEVLLCLDAATGRELWRGEPLPAPYEMNPAARGHGKGPKSTPVLAAGRVYTLGISGALSAHDAATGRLVWRKEFSRQFPASSPLYGTAMSPVVEGGLLIAHVGGHDGGALTAFDAATGAVKWSYDADGPAYSSPVVATLGGERQVLTFTQKEFVSVSAATGRPLWKLPARTGYDTNSNTPVLFGDTVILSLEGQGVLAVRPSRQGAAWAAQEVWRNKDYELYMNSPVLGGGTLYGFSSRKKGQLFALDAATGKPVWEGPGRAGENAALVLAGGSLVALTNDASLLVLPAGAKEYAPAAQYAVAQSQTWAHPLLLGDRLLVKDETTLASYSLD